MDRTHRVTDARTGQPTSTPFTLAEEEAADAADAALNTPANFPLSDLQLRIGLINSGISLSTIDAAIAAIQDGTQRAIAQVWWDRSITIHWDHPMRASLTALIGLSEEDAATMWMSAGSDARKADADITARRLAKIDLKAAAEAAKAAQGE